MTATDLPKSVGPLLGALDDMKRHAVAEVLDQLSSAGWVLYHPEDMKEVDPALLARRVERLHATLLERPGDGGIVKESSTPSHPEGTPMTDETMVQLRTKPCPKCGESEELTVPASAVAAYQDGALIQLAFPMLTDDQAERLITGLHGECWDEATYLFDDELGEEAPDVGK